MPYYEYHCQSNGKTLEVRHGMEQRVTTWGELGELAVTELDDTSPEAPVERLLSVPAPLTNSGATVDQPCSSNCGCFRGT